MSGARLAVVAVSALGLVGCAGAGASLTTPSASRSAAATTSSSTPAPPPIAVAVVRQARSQLLIYGSDGRLLASTSTSAGLQAQATAGPGGLFFVAEGRLRELTTGGELRDLAAVPSPAPRDGFAVSPDGGSIAYGVRTGSAEDISWHAQLWVAPIGGTPRLLADREVSESLQPGDAPGLWFYSVRSWTPHGILVVRAPTNVGGEGPFIGESYDAYTALVDPESGASTMLTADTACPLSTYGADGTAVCFRDTTTAPKQTTALVLRRADGSVQTAPLYGPVAGWSRLNSRGTMLAYDRVPIDTDSQLWPTAVTLHLRNLSTGEDDVVDSTGLGPLSWLPDGSLLAWRSRPNAQGGMPFATALVRVDATTRATTDVAALDDGDDVIGVITG